MRAFLTTAFLVLLFSPSGHLSHAGAQGIELESLAPRGAQRGTRFTVKLHGERLNLADRVLAFRPGLRLVEFRVIDDESAEAIIESDGDAPLGEHPFMLWGPKGVSGLATLHLGPFAVFDEQEPNDSPPSANAPERSLSDDGVTIAGEIEGADIDCFRFELEMGDRLSAEVEAMRLGGQFLDAFIDVVDPQGEVVASCDDTPLLKQDPIVSIVATANGTHTVRVRDAAFDGEYGSRYRLHIGSFARPTISYPCGGPAGEPTDVVMLGDACGKFSSTIYVPKSAGDFYLHHPDDGRGGPAPAPVKFRASDLKNVMEVEPNNSTFEANPVKSASVAYNGILSEPTDQDFFSFQAKAGEQFDVEVYAARVASPIDSVIEIYGPNGRSMARNDDGVVHDSTLRFVATETGRYWLRVADQLQRGGPTYVYRVEIQPVGSSLRLRIADLATLRPLSMPAISVPRGGRFAVLASIRRKNFAGEVEVVADTLPEGVKLAADPITADGHLAMLLFETEAQARLGAELVSMAAYSHTRVGTIAGELSQHVGLVFGEPRQTVYHSTEINRLPIAITEEAPFSITVEQPRASLAQDGVQELRVAAQRREGFSQPIELSALLLPKWVETSEDAAIISSGRTEGTFPLFSKAQAKPGSYPMILLGKSNLEGGEVIVASQRFTVRVAEPHATVRIALATAEQGSNTMVDCDINWLREPEGAATATLLGLPNHTAAPTTIVTPDANRFTFPVEVGLETPASIHNTLFVELSVPEDGEPCRQYLGRGATLEVYARGERANDMRSRLQVLRQQTRSRRIGKDASTLGIREDSKK